jgi:hypothetical protein
MWKKKKREPRPEKEGVVAAIPTKQAGLTETGGAASHDKVGCTTMALRGGFGFCAGEALDGQSSKRCGMDEE